MEPRQAVTEQPGSRAGRQAAGSWARAAAPRGPSTGRLVREQLRLFGPEGFVWTAGEWGGCSAPRTIRGSSVSGLLSVCLLSFLLVTHLHSAEQRLVNGSCFQRRRDYVSRLRRQRGQRGGWKDGRTVSPSPRGGPPARCPQGSTCVVPSVPEPGPWPCSPPPAGFSLGPCMAGLIGQL